MPIVFAVDRLPASISVPCLLAACAAAPLSGAVTVSYTYPDEQPAAPLYADPGLSKMSDGVALVPSWSTGVSPDIAPFVGWNDRPATIRYDFSEVVRLTSVRVWFGDSDGAAGVHMPDQVTLRNAASTFFELYAVTDPAGSGTTVALDFTFDPFETDHVLVIASNLNLEKEWIMITEITLSYSAVPEPSTYGLVLGGLALAGAALRRRKSAAA